MSFRVRGSAVIAGVAGILLALIFWYEAGVVRKTSSPTYDEVSYMQMAFRIREGNYLPLVRAGSAPLPVLLDGLALGPFEISDLNSFVLPRIMRRVRLVHVAAIGLPLVVGVYLWLLRRRGWVTAGCAALLLALSPTVIAHTSLATTDAAITFWSLVTLAALAWHHQRKSPWQILVVGLALGVAFASKYSAVCLLPAVLLSLGWWRGATAVAIASIVVCWLHGWFQLPLLNPEEYLAWLGNGPAHEHWMTVASHTNLPAPLVSALHQWIHQRGGADSFFMGDRDSSGWWSYFPVAISLKSTPVELAVVVAVPILVILNWRRRDHAFTLWFVTLVSFIAVLMLSRVNIGVRYALPAYPLAVLLVADALPKLLTRASIAAAVGVTAVAVQAFSSLTVAPHYLSYFNGLAGGPAGGYRYLADSNLDWGQDLPALAHEIAELGRPRVCVAYFGKAPVAPYGIDAVDWRNVEKCREAEWFAVSVTYLQVSYIDGHPFAPLLAEAPDRRAGFSIFLYDMRRPKVAQVLQRAWTLIPS